MTNSTLSGSALPLPGHLAGPSRSVGEVVGGRYRLVRRLGAGSMGEVFEAEHTEIPRRFALKTIQPRYLSEEEARRRFRTEAEVGALLQSPHLVSVFDFQLEGDVPFFVMELLEGEDVRSLLRRDGHIGVDRAVRIARGAAAGLRVAHRRGVVHRDLKPANLFLSEHGGGERCKVLDFGVAKVGATADCPLQALGSVAGKVVGTLAYMAPEQVRADRTLDGRADVYSLGAILYEMIAGRRRYEAGSDHELMYKILHGHGEPLGAVSPSCNPAVVAVVERATSMDPASRCSMEELYEVLDELAGDRGGVDSSLGTLDGEPAVAVVPQLPSARHWRPGLAMIASVGILGALALGLRPTPPTTEPLQSRAATAPSPPPTPPSSPPVAQKLVEPAASEAANRAEHPAVAPVASLPVSQRRVSKVSPEPRTLLVERRNPYRP